jgi:uncharacterized protein (DUF2141 family)
MKQNEMTTVSYFLTAVVAIVVASVATSCDTCNATSHSSTAVLVEDEEPREKKSQLVLNVLENARGWPILYGDLPPVDLVTKPLIA